MRRFGFTLLVVLVPLAALAKWQVFSVPGQGKAAWISDAGDYAVATTVGAYRLRADGGISEQIELGGVAMVDAFVDDRGCFVAVPQRTGVYLVYADAACGPTNLATVGLISSTDLPVRLRRAHGGAAYLSATNSSSLSDFFVSPHGGPASDFVAVSNQAPAKPSSALGALRADGVDVAFAGLSSLTSPLARMVDGGQATIASFPAVLVPVELAPTDGDAVLLTTSAGTLVRASALNTASPTWTPLPVEGAVRAIGYAPDTDLGGIGLGMVGSSDAGPVAFQFAAPLGGVPGQRWATNPDVPSYSGVAQAADCTVEGTCLAVTNAPDAGNVVVYTNEAKPTWSPPSLVVTDAGVTLPITVAPTDLDGDPLVVTWSAPPPLTVDSLGADGSAIDVDVPASAATCAQPFQDYALQGSLTDGLAAHRDTRTVTVRVQRVFSPLSQATAQLDAGYDPAGAQVTGAVGASGASCPAERGLGADVSLTVEGVGAGSQHLSTLPGGFAFPRTDCLPHSYAVTATLRDGDGGVGPAATALINVPGQDPAVDGLLGGPLVARCGEGAQGSLTARVPANACAAQTLAWAQQGGPALTQAQGTGEAIPVATQALGLQDLIGEQITLRLTATSGTATATALATVPIVALPFIDARTELEAPNPRTDSPLGVRVTVENPTACPITGAQLVEQVQDGELVVGSARIDGQPANASLVAGQVVVHGLDLAPGEQHQVTFDVRPRVLGPPAPSAQVLFRGVPISQNSSPPVASDSVGCSCRNASGGSEALLYVVLVGILLIDRKRHATLRDSVRKPLR